MRIQGVLAGSAAVRVWPDRGIVGRMTVVVRSQRPSGDNLTTYVDLLDKRRDGRLILAAPIGDPDQGSHDRLRSRSMSLTGDARLDGSG